MRAAVALFYDLRHRLAHRLKLNRGYVVSGRSGDAVWVAYRCADCGRVSGAHIAEHIFGATMITKESRRAPTEWRR